MGGPCLCREGHQPWRRQGLASQLTSQSLWDVEGTAAEDRLTFRDGILLVYGPQQLQGKHRRTTSAPGTGQDSQAGCSSPAWGWEGSISGHTGKTAVLPLSGEGAWREQNPESSRILELNKTLAVIKSNPLAKFPTSLTVVCSKVHSTEHWHCGTLTTLPQRGHHQGSLGNAE